MALRNFVIVVAGAISLLGTVCAQDEDRTVASPDRRFIFKFHGDAADEPFGIFSCKTGNILFKPPEETKTSFVRTVRCVWAPDSRQFALNYRGGGRYNTTAIYRWNGSEFVKAPDFELMLSERLDIEKNKELQAQGIKKETYQRRIWDSFSTKRWINATTLEVNAYSIRSVVLRDNDLVDIQGGLRFQIQRAKVGNWKILKQAAMSVEELSKTD